MRRLKFKVGPTSRSDFPIHMGLKPVVIQSLLTISYGRSDFPIHMGLKLHDYGAGRQRTEHGVAVTSLFTWD